MGADEPNHALDVASIARDFERVRRGYDPAAVDHHLALITSQVKRYIEHRTDAPDESLDLVLQATRRSVDEALGDARRRAEAIVAEAQAAALAIEQEAAGKCRALDAEARERYAEMVRLTDAQARALADLDTEISQRQQVLRATAADLERLAGAITRTAVTPAQGIAAMHDANVEIVLPAQPGGDA